MKLRHVIPLLAIIYVIVDQLIATGFNETAKNLFIVAVLVVFNLAVFGWFYYVWVKLFKDS